MAVDSLIHSLFKFMPCNLTLWLTELVVVSVPQVSPATPYLKLVSTLGLVQAVLSHPFEICSPSVLRGKCAGCTLGRLCTLDSTLLFTAWSGLKTGNSSLQVSGERGCVLCNNKKVMLQILHHIRNIMGSLMAPIICLVHVFTERNTTIWHLPIFIAVPFIHTSISQCSLA